MRRVARPRTAVPVSFYGIRLFSYSAPARRPSEPPPPLRDEVIAQLAQEHQHQLRLADLVKYGRPPLSDDALLQSARFALDLIPVRLARRLHALRNLPYIVVANPHVRQIYGNYRHSLQSLLPWLAGGGPKTLQDEIAFTDVLADLVATHHNTIPVLAQGFAECRKYIAPADVTVFLDEHLRARIGTRLIAEQHLALHVASRTDAPEAEAEADSAPPSPHIGIIDTQLRPARTVDRCAEFVADICELKYGVRPRWVINGGPGGRADGGGGPDSCTFAYVPMHLEYMVTELLKNAFRAVVENGMHREPVVVTIAPEPPAARDASESSSSSESFSDSSPESSPLSPPILPLDDNAPGVTIRIRDRGGGISPDVLPNIWSYSFTTFSPYEDSHASSPASSSASHHPPPDDSLNILSASGSNGGSSIAGLGYGLPLSRAYAEFFGGGITVQSLHGWGTDVYLRLKGVGTIQ